MNNTFDEQYERAKKAGEEADKTEPRAESARYDPRLKQIVIRLRNGEDFSFSPEWVPGLRGASPFDLANIEVSPSGAGLYWERLDEDLSLPELLQGVFGPVSVANSLIREQSEFFESLCAQIEIDWNTNRDVTLVDHLAAEHTEYSADLYDFFALLIESELDSEGIKEDPSKSGNTLNWLEKEGFKIGQDIVQQQREVNTETTSTDLILEQPKTSESESESQAENKRFLLLSQPLGYLGLAQEKTGMEIEKIEEAMHVPAAMTKFVQRSPVNKLRLVRREIVARGKHIGIEESEGKEALSHQLQRAAKRGTKNRESTAKSIVEQFKELVKQIPDNKLSREEKAYWIKLSCEEEDL